MDLIKKYVLPTNFTKKSKKVLKAEQKNQEQEDKHHRFLSLTNLKKNDKDQESFEQQIGDVIPIIKGLSLYLH